MLKKSEPRGHTGQGGVEDLGVSRQERPGDHDNPPENEQCLETRHGPHLVLDHLVDLSFVYEERKTSHGTLENPHGIL